MEKDNLEGTVKRISGVNLNSDAEYKESNRKLGIFYTKYKKIVTRCSNYFSNHPLLFPILWFIVIPFYFLLTFEFSAEISAEISVVLPQSAVDEIFGILIIFGPMFLWFIVSVTHYSKILTVFSTKKLSQIKIKQALTEYNFIKKYIYVILPITIFLFAVDTIQQLNQIVQNVLHINVFTLDYTIGTFTFIFSICVFGTVYSIVEVLLKKDFKFYYAGAYFRMINSKMNEAEQLKLVVLGLEQYQKYLVNRGKFRIGNIGKIYVKIISNSKDDMHKSIQDMRRMFEDGDTLGVFRHIIKNENLDDEKMIYRKSWVGTFKDLVPIIGVLITASIGLIPFIIEHIQRVLP